MNNSVEPNSRSVTVQQSVGHSNSRWTSGLLATGLLILVAFAVYSPTLSAGFVWDDEDFFVKHPFIKAPDGLLKFFFSIEPIDYFPLTSTSLWLEWRLWGLDFPAGYHATNILLHALGAALLWRVLKRLRVPGAYLAALVFTAHPVCVMSVAWITERKNTLSLPLFMLCLLAWLRYEEASAAEGRLAARRIFYLISLAMFILTMLAKQSPVLAPFLLLLLAWRRRGRITGKDVLAAAPFLCVSLIIGGVEWWFQRHNAIGDTLVRLEDWPSRIAGTGWALWFYLIKALWPAHVNPVYPRWAIAGNDPLAWLPGIMAVALIALCFMRREKLGRSLILALGYILLMLLPVLGFVSISFMRFTLASDHWQYLALIGVIALVCGIAANEAAKHPPRSAWLLLAAVVVVGLGGISWKESQAYRNDYRIWQDSISKNPQCSIGYYNLGVLARGVANDELSILNDTDRQNNLYIKTIECNDLYYEPRLNLCQNYELLGEYDKALGYIKEALRIQPKDSRLHTVVGNVYHQLGNYVRALDEYTAAIKLKKDYAPAYFERGCLYAELQQWDSAIEDLTTVCGLVPRNDPLNVLAPLKRAFIRAGQGQYALAMKDYNLVAELAPDDAATYHDRAVCHYYMGNYDAAWADARRSMALGLRPKEDFLEQLRRASGRNEMGR